jgi:hypothetical protein
MKKETIKKVVYTTILDGGESVIKQVGEVDMQTSEKVAIQDCKEDFDSDSIPDNCRGYRVLKITYELEKEMTPPPVRKITKKDNEIDWGF